jgi:hypothetical protein
MSDALGDRSRARFVPLVVCAGLDFFFSSSSDVNDSVVCLGRALSHLRLAQ